MIGGKAGGKGLADRPKPLPSKTPMVRLRDGAFMSRPVASRQPIPQNRLSGKGVSVSRRLTSGRHSAAGLGGELGGRTRHRLTATALKAAGPGRHQDGAGLFLEKSEKAASWVYRYSLHGRRREMGLGSWPDLSLAEARKARDRWAETLARGLDPIVERERMREEERRAAAKAEPTLAEAVARVHEAIAPTLRDGGERGRWLSPLTTHVLPVLGARRLSTIHAEDVRDALKPIWRTKAPTAEKAIQRLGIVFRRGKRMKLPCDPTTVEEAREMLGEVRHEAEHIPATPWQDVPTLYARLCNKGPSHLCLRLLILTAVRSTPARLLRFGEVEGDVWTIPEANMKGRAGAVGDFRVPLSAPALDVLREAQEAAEGDLAFAGARGGAVTSRGLEKALDALGEPGRPHGFRTSFRTWVQDTGACSWEVAETALAHKVGGKVERSYSRSDLLDQRREVMAAWGAFVTCAPGHAKAGE